MTTLRKATLLFFCTGFLASCGNSRDSATIYVLAPPQKSSAFVLDLARIVESRGLSADVIKPGPRPELDHWGVEAKGRWLWLWATDVPISRYSDNAPCGRNANGRPDPEQYVVMIDHGLGYFGLNHVLARISPGGPTTFASEISRDLKKSGYIVRASPAMCSSPPADG